MNKTILVDGVSNAYLLNRYLACINFKKYDTSRGRKFNHVIVKQKRSYQIQWKNIKTDLVGLFQNPLAVSPRIAYSLAAFLFILLGKHEQAIQTAFFMGAVSFDAASQSATSGEPATITWNHTIGAGSNRLLTIFEGGLDTPNLATWDGNATTEIISNNPARSSYYLAPATGTAAIVFGGGNIKVGGAISLENVNQTDPIGATNSSGDNALPFDMALTTEADNSMRIDAMVANNNNATTPSVALDSGTLRFNYIAVQNQFQCGYFGYTNFQAVAGADTYTWSGTANETRKYLAIEIKAAPTIALTGTARLMTGVGI